MANTDQTSGNRIFISCVSGEFEHPSARYPGFRSLLRKALVRADCEVKVQEEFRQTEVDTVEKLDSYIRRCAAVLHFVGEMPGAIAHKAAVTVYLEKEPNFLAKLPDLRAQLGDCSDLTFTQWEAFIALHHGVPLFVYANDKAVPNQEKHLKRLESVSRFASPLNGEADLFSQLIGDLRNIVPPLGKAAQRLGNQNFLHHTAELFLGREKELELLDTAWADGTNVLALIAWGGVGKTALLSEWIQTRFIDKQWLADDGQPALLAYFDWSFYDQGTGSLAEGNVNRTGNVGDFFEQALAFFGDADPTAPGKGARLAKLVRQQRTLLILDGLEPLQYPIGNPMAGRLLDPDLCALVTSLVQSNRGLCIVNSRQELTDLRGLHGAAARQQILEDLPRAVAVELLCKMNINGTAQELAEACDKFHCHALSITLLGRYLFDAHQGDILRIDRVDLHKADKLTREDRQRTAWKVLEAYDAWLGQVDDGDNPRTLAVLRLTGLFDRTATADCLAALRAEPVIPGLTDAIVGMDNEEWRVLLHQLERAHLIKLRVTNHSSVAIDAHPLVRQYFAEQLKNKAPQAYRLAHSLLFDHLCKQTKQFQPDDLSGLMPLYQAVAHGCLAKRYEEARKNVYIQRILRGTDGNGFYSWKRLGAVSSDLQLLSNFFDRTWSQPFPEIGEQHIAWLQNEASQRLRALGRLAEAREISETALGWARESKRDFETSVGASNLACIEVKMGLLQSGLTNGQLAFKHWLSLDSEQRKLNWQTHNHITASHAHTLFQIGRIKQACRLFKQAELTQSAHHEHFPFLYSISATYYTLLLLRRGERCAWRSVVTLPNSSLKDSDTYEIDRGFRFLKPRAVNDCQKAMKRIRFTKLLSDNLLGVLEKSLDLVGLAKSMLYLALIENLHSEELQETVDSSLEALRRANDLIRFLSIECAFHVFCSADGLNGAWV
jgi:hypothetical protein